MCSRCRFRKRFKSLKICKRCSDYIRKWHKDKTAQDKQACMNHYGRNGGCVCCCENRITFLSIDHIKDDGYKNRDTHGLGKHLYRMLVKNNFPKGFQVQWGKRLGKGFCPHHPKKDLRNA